jgi:hypothetical protein
MPNRFTDDLLTNQDRSLPTAVYGIVQRGRVHFFPHWWRVAFTAEDANEYTEISDTMICLLAAMSDADIDELIINWKE